MKLFFKVLILFLFVTSGNFVFAQSNPNIKTVQFKDISPGVSGSLTIITETTSADTGTVSIKGNLRYDFPPQPNSIGFTVKNIGGKGAFKDFTQTRTSQTPEAINLVFENIPLDKSSATNTLATKDRFQITSMVDKGVDFFFPSNSNPTYLSFNKFTQTTQSSTTQTGQQQGGLQTGSLTTVTGSVTTRSLVVNSVKNLQPIVDTKTKAEKPRAEVEFVLLSLMPQNYPLPSYLGLARTGSTSDYTDYIVDDWQKIEDPDAPRPDGMILGITRHTFIVEKGTTYTFRAWVSQNPGTKPLTGSDFGQFSDGTFLNTFIINTDYIFGKPVSNTAPGLAPINQAAIDSAWASITSTFQPGSIDFFKIGSTNTVPQASENAYIFLSKIPGLANSSVTKDVKNPDGSIKSETFDAFDPTQKGSFSKYIGVIINMVYGFIALVAVINIIRYGVFLMISSATPFEIKENKKMILNSFIALGIALGSYLLLNTINPNLTNLTIGIDKIKIDGAKLEFKNFSADGSLPENYVGTKGISCEKCFVYPVDPKTCPGNQTRGDHGGYRGAGPLGGNSADLACPVGTRVQSVSNGVVFSVGSGCEEGNQKCGSGMGNYVIVKHTQNNGKPWYSIYMHLSQLAVKADQKVSAREEIGKTGNTGYSTGAHLHFETANENFGQPGKQKYPNCVLALTCDSYK